MTNTFSIMLVAALAVSAGFAVDARKEGPGYTSQVRDGVTRSHPNDGKIIDEINGAKMSWKAGSNAIWEKYSDSELVSFTGTDLESLGAVHHGMPAVNAAPEGASIPDSFDSREEFKGFIHPIRNQMRCGSCWAFAAAESLSDRFTIASKGKIDVVLSPEDLVSCDITDNGCSGGMIPNAWNYLTKTGIVSDKCFPYTAGTGSAPTCETQCEDGEDFKKYKAKNPVHLTSVEAIQHAIMTGGPVEAGFMVHKSFMSYKSGVYQHQWWKVWDQVLGGHAVKIIGWGTEDGLPYWLVANSWSSDWGEDGYFKILRGKNECQFESSVFAGDAVVDEE